MQGQSDLVLVGGLLKFGGNGRYLWPGEPSIESSVRHLVCQKYQSDSALDSARPSKDGIVNMISLYSDRGPVSNFIFQLVFRLILHQCCKISTTCPRSPAESFHWLASPLPRLVPPAESDIILIMGTKPKKNT